MPTSTIQAEVRQAARAWMDAAARRDVEALDRVLAAEFSMVTNRGSLINKAQWMENMLHRVGPDFTPPEFLDVSVLVAGTVALMTSRTMLRATFDGKDWSGDVALTDVWLQRDGRWQIVRRHSSNLIPGAS